MTSPQRPPDGDAGITPADSGWRWTFRRKLNLIAVIVLLTALIAWLTAYQTTRRMAETTEYVARVQEILVSVRDAADALPAAEAAHRASLLNAQDKPQQEYRAAIDRYHSAVANLRQLVNDPRQHARLDSLATLMTAPPPFPSELGARLDDLARNELLGLSIRVEEARARVATVRLALIGNVLLTLLVLCGSAVLLNRYLSRQERDEKSLRAALRAADAASGAKSRFLATVSHEIRTPLNAVSGMTQLLLDTRLNSEQREFARTVHSNAEALSILIGDLLDTSKIEAGQVDLEAMPFDLWELVEGVVEILVVRADIKGVELILDLAPDAPRSLVGDRNRLRQVLMNLVGNAVKFTEQGHVIVRLRSRLSADGRAATSILSVIDTGVGIPIEAQRRIFEPFVQADTSTVRRYSGTGLGLNISRSLIQLMGGTLSLESTPGRGSTLEAQVTLPLADTQPPAEFNPASLADIEVMLKVPNETARETMVQLLRFAGASVRPVTATDEVFDSIAQKCAARVLILDEPLQDTTAIEFARTVWQGRASRDVSNVGVVLLCSLRSTITRHVGTYGIVTGVYKPVKPARLVLAVRQAAGLEVEEQKVVAADRPAETRGGPVPIRILLVEDNRDNWALATRILASAGYDVELAEDGVKAVELATVFHYDLILMDVEMPQMDGIEAARRIRDHERAVSQQPVPIVALTAHAVEDVRQQARAAGMDDYMTKPVQKQQLLEACARWIDLRSVLLIADDSPENHMLLANYLSGGAYRLVSVYNGRDAVAAFERQRVSLVLLDMEMPVMDGYDAARAIRRARGGDIVPIVAFTGYEGQDERQRCLQAGCTSHLAKPVHRADLLTMIESLLGEPLSRGAGRPPSTPPAPHSPPAGEVVPSTGARLPSDREASVLVQTLLARRDFHAIVALAESLQATAKALELNKLATVSDELADAARHEDEHRSAWWSDQLGPVLNEAQRLDEVHRHLGTTVGGAYDSLARLATTLLGVPVVTVALLDEDRLRLKGGVGLPPPFDTTRELRLSVSLGRIVVAQGRPLLVEDARTDPRVRDTPLVTTYGLASYAAVPLTNARGVTLGAFCAMDRRPRSWLPEDVATLEDLASVANSMLELERQNGTAAVNARDSAAPMKSVEPATAELALVTVEEDIVDLVPDYVASRRRDVETLCSLLRLGDFAGIRRLGHNMKGSGEGYGLREVTRIGRSLEQAAERGDAGSLNISIDELRTYLSRLSIRAADGRVVMEAQP